MKKPQISSVYFNESSKEYSVVVAHDNQPDIVHVLKVKDNRPIGLTEKIGIEYFAKHEVKEFEESPFYKDADETKVSEKSRLLASKRYNAIKPLADNPKIFDPSERFKLIKAGVEGFGKCALLKLLPQYWMRGCTENALLPDFQNSGGRGKQKEYKENIERKLSGNSNKTVYVFGDADGKILVKNYTKYFKGKRSKKDSYIDYKNKFYDKRDKFPSQKQVVEWAKKLLGKDAVKNHEKDQKESKIDNRILTGSALDFVFGPGSEFLIDSTVDNVYVQSEDIPGAVVGRLTLYFIVDVYTGLICGFYFTNEHPSYLVACKALLNAATDKVVFCKKYGREIVDAEWPCKHIPLRLIADRGELVANVASNIVKNLNIKLNNLPPYRADMKGYVETQFKTFQLKLKSVLENYGLVDKNDNSRLVVNPAKNARLTLTALIKLLINEILHYNKTHFMWDHPDINSMIAAGIEPSPIEIWRWAKNEGRGNLRRKNELDLWRNLLSRDKWRCITGGIQIKGDSYMPIDKKYNYIIARLAREKIKAEVAAVPYAKTHKYLYYNKEFIPLYTRRGPTSSSDFEFQFSKQLIEEKSRAADELTRADEFEVAKANKLIVEEAVKSRAKPKTVKDIKANRAAETDRFREKELDELDPSFQPPKGKSDPSKKGKSKSNRRPSQTDKLRKLKLH